MKARILYRISAVLLVLFAAGHTFGFRQVNPAWGADAVVEVMRSVHFNAEGFTRTYWDFFSAFGLFFSVFLLFAAVVAWVLGGLPAEILARVRSDCVGARHLLRGNHGAELGLCLHHPHRFLNPDHSVFDCRRVVLSEDGLTTASCV